jgi:hypothetical protein
MSTDKLSDSTTAAQPAAIHDTFVHERTSNLSVDATANALNTAQKTVDTQFGNPEITNQVQSTEPDWQQTLSNRINQDWASIVDIPKRVAYSVEEHYRNPYGNGFDADWADMNSTAPLDRRVLDTLKAMFDGPKEAFDRLNAALGS